MTAQSTDLLSLGPVDIIWSSWRPLYVVIKKQGPIKPSHQRQILPAQQSLLITANSWRSFQRGLYQGQEHLDLNYPWHNVWPFCYHRGGQHLLRGHGPRGHRGYPGQQCKQSPPQPPTNFFHISSSSYRSLSLPPSTATSPEKEFGQFRSLRIWVVMWVVVITLKPISWGRLWTGLSHDVQTHDLGAAAAKGLEVSGSNLQSSRIHLHLRAMQSSSHSLDQILKITSRQSPSQVAHFITYSRCVCW